MFKEADHIFVLRILNGRHNVDVRNLWVCWFILLTDHQIALKFDKLTTKGCAKNNTMCDIFFLKDYINFLQTWLIAKEEV